MDYVITAVVTAIISALCGLYGGYRWGQAAAAKLYAAEALVKKVL